MGLTLKILITLRSQIWRNQAIAPPTTGRAWLEYKCVYWSGHGRAWDKRNLSRLPLKPSVPPIAEMAEYCQPIIPVSAFLDFWLVHALNHIFIPLETLITRPAFLRPHFSFVPFQPLLCTRAHILSMLALMLWALLMFRWGPCPFIPLTAACRPLLLTWIKRHAFLSFSSPRPGHFKSYSFLALLLFSHMLIKWSLSFLWSLR